jgi:hypothetical protein
MNILDDIRPVIRNIRRGIDVERNFERFRVLVEGQTERVCSDLDTRWLVSVCDTYADFGTPVESRNAMFVSLLANFEKVSQSYVYWKLGYEGSLEVPADHEPRKVPLWDGMSSFHLSVGDVTNNLFARLGRLMEPTPHIARIYETVRDRLRDHETILGALNKYHRHVFDTDFSWSRDREYDRWRKDGTIPKWKR